MVHEARTVPVPTHAEATPPKRAIASAAALTIATVMVIGTLRLGRVVVLPVVISVLLTLLLSAPVRWLQRRRIPERIAAALVVFGALGVGLGGMALLASPAIRWAESAPETMQKIEIKVRHLIVPLMRLQRSADRMQQATGPATANAPQTVQLASPGILTRVSAESVTAIPLALTVVFLTYFLLANGPLFRRKLAGLLPGGKELKRREHLLGEIELAASHFLVTVAAVNTGVGVLTTLTLWAVGVPTPMLWGAFATLLNFVPYLGPIVTITIITFAALAGVDEPARALLAPAGFLLIHLIETNVVTPMLLGRLLPVNTVAIFLGLLFFGGLWGIPGAVLAVPLTVCVKLVCDHVPSLAHIGQLLDS